MTTMIDRQSPIPMYFQLKQILLEKIEGQEWLPGALIPSEQEFQDMYGLSRTTVRQTLSELVYEGVLVRQRGRGTYVSRPKLTHGPTKRLNLTEMIRQQGLEPGWRILERRWVQPNRHIQEVMHLNPETRVYRIVRLRLVNDEVIGYHAIYLTERYVAYIDAPALERGESTAYIEKAPEMQSSMAQRSIEAVAADDVRARALGIEEGSPLLQIERVISATDGTVIEFLQAAYRGDRFKYQIST